MEHEVTPNPRYSILVIDDDVVNRNHATETLGKHDLTVVGSYDVAKNLMDTKFDEGQIRSRLLRQGHYYHRDLKPGRSSEPAYWNAYYEAHDQSEIPFPFDVVLTDMMLPMSQEYPTSRLYKAGQLEPLGLILALMAAKRGAKFVALATDINHHDSAMSGGLDELNPLRATTEIYSIDSARVIFTHAPMCQPVTQQQGLVKNWEVLLKMLTTKPEE